MPKRIRTAICENISPGFCVYMSNNRDSIDCYIKPQLGHKQVSLVTSQDIQRMHRRLKKESRIHEHSEDGYGLSDATVNHIHTMLHGAMKDAVQAHIIPKNPTEGPTVPRPNYKPPSAS